jgi:hypothetical protein
VLSDVDPLAPSAAVVVAGGARAVGADVRTLTMQSPAYCDLMATELQSPSAVMRRHGGGWLTGVDDKQPVALPTTQQQQQQERQQQVRARAPRQQGAVAAAAAAAAAIHPAPAPPLGFRHRTSGIDRAAVDRAAARASTAAAAAAAAAVGVGSGWVSARGACRRQWSSSRLGEGSVLGLWRKAGLLQQMGSTRSGIEPT